MLDILKCYPDSNTLAAKLQVFHNSIVSHSQKRLDHTENQTKYRKMTRKPQSHVRIKWASPVIMNTLGLVSVIVWYCEKDFLVRHSQGIIKK